MVTVTNLYIFISYIYTYSYNFLFLIIFSFLLQVNLFRYMFYVFGISPIYTFTVFLSFVIFYLSLSFLALMHFYHVFIACSIYSFRYVYNIFISYISYSSTYHLIYSLSNGFILHIIFCACHICIHILLSWLYTIPFIMFYFHVLFSRTVIMYYVHVLISYTVFMYCFMYCTCSYTFRVIDTLLLVLVYLSLHRNVMLLILCHIFNLWHLHILVIFFYVSCLHKPYKWIQETIRARRYCTHCVKQWSIRARRRCTHCAKHWFIRAEGAVIIVRDNDHL